MNRKTALNLFSFVFVFVFAGAVMTTPAFADDSPPPAEDAAPVVVEDQVVEENVPQLLAEVPEDTQVVVVDENGEALPLASQQAEQVVVEGDPMWCPAGVSPKANTSGCSPDFLTVGIIGGAGLLNWMDTHDVPKAGTIWFAYNYNNAFEPMVNDDITISGGDFANLQKFGLTLQGGWNGVAGPALNVNTPYSTFGGSLSIINWEALVTVKNIQITGATTNPNTEDAALYVQTSKGGITLNNVYIHDNTVVDFDGAYLDTTAAVLGSPAPISVNDSAFINNYGSGLVIKADGAVKIKNVTANFNGVGGAPIDYGVFVDNYWNNLDQPVTFSGTNNIVGNYGNGLYIGSFGAITLNNMNVSYNDDNVDDGAGDGYGAYINNNHGATASNVSLTGVNTFNYNQLTGLQVISNGNITTNNLTVNYNGQYQGDGALFDNCLAAACTTLGKTVTLNGTNSFIGNQATGLKVYSGGAIKIANLTANDNSYDGVYLNNCNYNGSVCTSAVAPVTITGFANINNNGHASNQDGIEIYSRGAIIVANLTAVSNEWWGANLNNNYDLVAHPNITLTGVVTVLNNGGTGLYAYSYGAVKAGNVTASNNGAIHGGYGMYVDNRGYDVGVSASVLPVRQNVSLSGTNTFLNNNSDGLVIYSVGTITVNNLSASFNGDGGVYLESDWGWKPNFALAYMNYAAPINVTGFLTANNNANGSGVEIYAPGKVGLKNVTANNNYGYGLYIESWGSTSPQTVTLLGVNTFLGNGAGAGTGDGLYIYSDGTITVNSLTASGNDGRGAYFNNSAWAWTNKFLGVNLKGTSTFQGNVNDGLYVTTDGSVSLSNIIADKNGDEGVELYATKNITLSCGSAFDNTGTGFFFSFGGIATFKGIHAFRNGIDSNLPLPYLSTIGGCP